MHKLFCILLFIPVLLQAQSFNQNNITCYRVTTVLHFEDKDSVFNHLYNDTTLIYLSGKMILYQRVGYQLYSNSSTNPKEDFEIKTSRYFIYDTTENVGFCFTGLEDIGWINIDSFKAQLSYEKNGKALYSQFAEILLTVIPDKQKENKDIWIEAFPFNNTVDTTVKGKVIFKYNNRLNCHISLSPELDSLKQAKLCEIRMNMPKIFSKETNHTSYPFSVTTSLEQLAVTEPEIFRLAVEKYLAAVQKK
jgi:hypothetical protein